MADSSSIERPSGVTAIAIVLFAAAAYLFIVGLAMLIFPGTVPMALGTPLLGGAELAGPYMFTLIAAVDALMGWGLLELNRWARRAAILLALAGIVQLIPVVSMAVIQVRAGPLIWGGLGVMVRTMIVWYLYQEPVAEVFLR